MGARVLLVGQGGREHATAWKLLQSPRVEHVFVAPGNSGTGLIATNLPPRTTDIEGIVAAAKQHRIDFYLAVTFTNKAAKEMRERLDALVGHADASALTVGTFHSLCARFLRRDINHLGRERDFSVYDGDDQDRLMRRVLRDLNLDEKQNPPRAIHARISSATTTSCTRTSTR